MNPIQSTENSTSPHPLEQPGVVRASLGLCATSLLVCGFIYSLAGVGLGQTLFSHQANGSMIEQNGQAKGSALVAQPFSQAQYFHPRASAANYDVMALAGSNMARTNPDLRKRIADDSARIAQQNQVAISQLPSDLVTQSGSGIDPEISPEAARLQVTRVAQTRGLPVTQVQHLVEQHIQSKQWGLFGAPRVNVLKLNLALDSQAGGRP